MLQRREFAAVGLSAAALAALQATGFAQDRRKKSAAEEPKHNEHSEAFQECAKACAECARVCDMCTTNCAHKLHAGQGEHITTLMTCQDCADICACAAQCCARGGPFVGQICQACADVCAKCEEACEKFPDDKHMAACAAECRKCETACRAMLQHAG